MYKITSKNTTLPASLINQRWDTQGEALAHADRLCRCNCWPAHYLAVEESERDDAIAYLISEGVDRSEAVALVDRYCGTGPEDWNGASMLAEGGL